MVLIGTSTTFGIVLSFEQTAVKLGNLVEPLGYFGFILVVNIVFLIAGMFLDMYPAILILAPVFAPVAAGLGIHPFQFGMIVIINLVIGLITPPMGQILFVVSSLADVKFEALCREIMVFVIIEIAVLLLVSYVPFLTLWVPGLMGYH
jgi:TRAP-type C4-dicarboxylate transport system permease large subunit